MSSGEERARKYIAKYNPEITRQRLVATREEVFRKYPRGVRRLRMIEDVVAEILNDAGIAGGLRATYHGFARKLQKRLYTHSLVFWDQLTEGCVYDWSTSYGLDKEILETIGKKVNFAMRIILSLEGKVQLSEKELELIKEGGKKIYDMVATRMKEGEEREES